MILSAGLSCPVQTGKLPCFENLLAANQDHVQCKSLSAFVHISRSNPPRFKIYMRTRKQTHRSSSRPSELLQCVQAERLFSVNKYSDEPTLHGPVCSKNRCELLVSSVLHCAVASCDSLTTYYCSVCGTMYFTDWGDCYTEETSTLLAMVCVGGVLMSSSNQCSCHCRCFCLLHAAWKYPPEDSRASYARTCVAPLGCCTVFQLYSAVHDRLSSVLFRGL